ncbi:MAG TPA: thiamine phosphate synthase [Terriglobales bacterium]
MNLPCIYPIIDLGYFATDKDPLSKISDFAEDLMSGGATLIQLRDKRGDALSSLSYARELRRITRNRAQLIINDRADLALAADADGVHLGQDDLPPAVIREIFAEVEEGKEKRRLWIGFSTHNLDQVRQANSMPVDYVAVGPVFGTSSKAKPDPVVGLEGVRQARQETTKPLVAIGGITRSNCLGVREAGADSVAVISDLLESPVKAVEEFLRILG